MPAVFVALMVLVFLLIALGTVLLFSRLVKAEAAKVHAARTADARTNTKS
jgi:hypothetical protein